MTTEQIDRPLTLDLSGTPRTPFLRLVRVEWRKMLDTRAGFWLLAITGLMLLLTISLTLLVVTLTDSTVTASGLSEILMLPVSVLIPVFAVLTVTNEWGQRTHMVTFALEPRRLRVIAAKLSAVSGLAVLTIVVAIVLGALGNLMYGVLTGNEVVWDLEASTLAWAVTVQILFFLMGFGLATLLLNTPGAIALFYLFGFILPFMVYAPLLAFFDWARAVLPWVDMNLAGAPLMAGVDLTGRIVEVGLIDYARFGSAVLIWVVIPVTLGSLRVLRAEPR
ncbi:ABC transporter permease [Nocardioides limicola]|uniref:ABC transporter permease n=1 Tax=Nocardioides limicola TaxID=2803368 RepID=UPI00193B8111|nr:ABC transporter permease [Nocardioides sp. DJM-14]